MIVKSEINNLAIIFDMKIDQLTPDVNILAELGQRLGRIRKQQGVTQTTLAQEAGLGVATLRRIEAGQDSQMESWIKILKALRMTPSLEALLPESFDSPMAEVLRRGKRRKKKMASAGAPMWGDQKS